MPKQHDAIGTVAVLFLQVGKFKLIGPRGLLLFGHPADKNSEFTGVVYGVVLISDSASGTGRFIGPKRDHWRKPLAINAPITHSFAPFHFVVFSPNERGNAPNIPGPDDRFAE